VFFLECWLVGWLHHHHHRQIHQITKTLRDLFHPSLSLSSKTPTAATLYIHIDCSINQPFPDTL